MKIKDVIIQGQGVAYQFIKLAKDDEVYTISEALELLQKHNLNSGSKERLRYNLLNYDKVDTFKLGNITYYGNTIAIKKLKEHSGLEE